ncbi:MAG: LysR family transcriptional regulator [Hyphomicrobiales bacterium]|nr:LysR family transcriptional regulator [Hyphomicrobiales bacterium]
MSRAKFSELAGFVAVATHLSFHKAAVDLGVSASALSHAMRQLEDRLSLRLLNRTTRSVALTEAGQRLFARLQPAFLDIAGAVEDLNALRDAPVGTVRINAPRQAIRLALIPLAARFVTAYPGVTLDIVADDALTDVVAEGFDAGVRFGEIIAQDMIATPLGPPQGFAVVASPDYFAVRPKPQTPADLRDHVCIRYRLPGRGVYRWEFAQDGAPLEIEVAGPLIFDDSDLVLSAAVVGMGVAYVFERQAAPLIQAGRLQRALEDWCSRRQGFFLYYPSRRNLSFALRAFVDFLKETRTEP